MIFNMNSGAAKKCPVLDASYPANLTVVAGNNATFSVKITEDGKPNAYTYQWYMDGTAVSGATAASYTANTSSLKGVYSIWCEVTNAAGTVTSKTATLTVNKTPVLSTSAPANAAVTSGTNATFSVVVGTAGYPASYAYQWYLNDSAVSGATGSSCTVDTSAMKGTYSVYCKVTNAAGTVQTRTATLTVNKTPVLNTSYPADASTIGTSGSLTFKVEIATAGFPASYTYQWYVDGNAVSGATGTSYTKSGFTIGSHTVYCKVTNTAGSVQSRTAAVTVKNHLPTFTYSGNAQLIDEGSNNWKLKLLTSGVLKFTDLGSAAGGIDAFLVGGGGAGGGSGLSGGSGGGGGYTLTKQVALSVGTEYNIIVGGGSGNTTAFGLTANCGGNGTDPGTSSDYGVSAPGGDGTGKGGNGGGSGTGSPTAGGDGGAGAYEFGDSTYSSDQYGGGGGGGGGYSGGDVNVSKPGGAGGAGGGGAGGHGALTSSASGHGTAGTANTGGGGGGNGGGYNSYAAKAGGSGIVIIRNKR